MVKFTQRNIQLKDGSSNNRKLDRQITFLLFALALGLYLRTMAPGLLAGDSGEFQFSAWRLGLAHATGYPLYLIVGWLWQHLLEPIAISPATALNALSALFGALATSILYIVMVGWLQGPLALRRAIAVFTVLLLTVNPTFWSQNLIAEVYTLHVLLLLLLFWAIQRLQLPDKITDTSSPSTIPLGRLLSVAFLLGLALTHHAMTLLALPSLLLYFGHVTQHWRNKTGLWRSALLALLVTALPLLLYFYIPLRSGPESSPWYHQPLGDTTLTLYENDWPSFINFITGRSISVGFHTFAQAWSNLAEARLLWQLHFQWTGLALIVLGLIFLVRERKWPLLVLTIPYAILQQIFNLFYAIDDILVYYIPLYVIGVIWAGFGAQSLALKAWQLGQTDIDEKELAHDRPDRGQTLGIFVVVIGCLLPLSLYRTYLPHLDQRESTTARQTWESIVAAEPPADAILVSNDRNEIVPLFYLQHVEQRAQGMTGLFPLIKPSDDFADVGMVIENALESGTRPVYLIKEMAGLEIKFSLRSVTPPLVQVLELAANTPPEHLQGDNFGPLRLLGYNWLSHDDGKEVNQKNVEIVLYWQVLDEIDRDYTTTIQLFDAMNEKIGQDDRRPGGDYYPTSFWKRGEILVDNHKLALPLGGTPTRLLVGMYHNGDMSHLAPSLEIDLRAISTE